ncbi:MAG: bifunctional phosphoglucose/phosphomannose isomerase [Flavobacteriales bacterium]|nr:bifunctional phosphoglucose/phosphomannose isomerase [Flavobacteriales bacterium]
MAQYEKNMTGYVKDYTQHLRQAVEIGKRARFDVSGREFHNIVVTGLGGSGIGGTIVSQLVQDQLKIPMLVNNDYQLPAYVGEHSLVIVSSYSGNTEETLSAMEIAMERGAEIACITAGGKVKDLAEEKGFNFIQIPGGIPPRGSFGLNSPQLLYVLHQYGFINDTFEKDLLDAADAIDANEEAIQQEARGIAEQVHGTVPIIYSDAAYQGVSIRLRQQINENAKMLCWHHVFPEMNHNELVGWAGGDERFSVIMMRTEGDHFRTQMRMNLCKSIFKKHTDKVFEIHAKGENVIERSYYLIHVGDWLSVILADLNGVDAIEVDVIDYLKGELAKN